MIGLRRFSWHQALATLCRECAVTESINTVEAAEDFLVMGHDDDCRLALLCCFSQEIHHHASALGIQGRGWFVGQDDVRPVRQCTGDCNALSLAAGQGGWQCMGPVC